MVREFVLQNLVAGKRTFVVAVFCLFVVGLFVCLLFFCCFVVVGFFWGVVLFCSCKTVCAKTGGGFAMGERSFVAANLPPVLAVLDIYLQLQLCRLSGVMILAASFRASSYPFR